MKVYVREFGWVLIAQGVTFLGGLAAIKLAASLLGPMEYGKLAVALAIAGVAQVCLFGAIAQTATRYFASARQGGSYARYEATLAGFAATAITLVCLLCAVALVTGLDRHLPVDAIALSIYAIATGGQMVVSAIINAARNRKTVALIQTADSLSRPIALFALIFTTVITATVALIFYSIFAIAILASSLILYSRLKKTAAIKANDTTQLETDIRANQLAGSMRAFALPFVAFGLLGIIGSHGERLLLANWATWSDIGSYALMSQLTMAPNVLYTSVLNQFYLPLVFQHDSDKKSVGALRSYKIYLLMTVLGVVALTVLIALSGGFLIRTFSSHEFLGNEHLFWYLGLSAGFFCIAQQLTLPGLRLNSPIVYMPAKFAHSLSLLFGALILVPMFGLTGMAVASALSAFVYFIAVLLANAWLQKARPLAS